MVTSSIFLLKHRGSQAYLQKASQCLPLSLHKTTFIKPLHPTAGARSSFGNLCCSDTAFHLNFKYLKNTEAAF